MKTKLILTTIAITLFATTVLAAPAKLQVALSLSPNKTLPALSVPLYLRIRNGVRALELSPAVRVRATSPIGESFLTNWNQRRTSGLLEFGLTDEEDTRIVRRAIELHPKSPVVPALRYAIALGYGTEAGRVFSVEGDLEKAVALAEKDRAELTRLKSSRNAWSRLIGNRKVGEFPSREYFVELRRLKEKAAKRNQ